MNYYTIPFIVHLNPEYITRTALEPLLKYLLQSLNMNQIIAWLLLLAFSTFDNVVSYIAVTQKGTHELNPLIANLVETYPLLYFLCIPLTLIGMYLLHLLIRISLFKILEKRYHPDRKVLSNAIATGMVIYWGIGCSSFNILYLLGVHGITVSIWLFTSLIGFLLGILYAYLYLKKALITTRS